MASPRRRLLLLIASLPVVVLASAAVYKVGMEHLEQRPRDLWQSVEFVAETLTTTGYGRDHSWSHPAMVVFVVVLQFLGVFLVFLIFPIYLIPFLEERFEARLPRQVPRLADHVVIYRYGPAVETLIEELGRDAVPYVVAELDEAVTRRLMERRIRVVYGTATSSALEGARVATARALIANGNDEENAGALLAARQLELAGEILTLVEEPAHRQPMMLAGASAVFTPRHILAAALAARASHRISPRVAGIQQLGRGLEVSEIRVDEKSELAGRTLAEGDIGARTGTTVIGQWVGGRLLTQPTAAMRLVPGGILVAVGSAESLRKLAELAGGSPTAERHGPLVVAGHGEVGKKVVELLRAVEEPVVVIDLKGGDGVTLEGDVLEPRILAAAGVDTARAVILALDSDSATLFATVVLKDRAGDVPIIARVNEAENVERIHRAGADFALSISQVSGQMLAHRLLRQESVSIDPQLRVLKVATAGLAGKNPSELHLRERTGCSVVAVERGDEVIVELPPTFTFRAEDAVYVCGSSEATHRFQQLFPAA